MYDPCWYIWMMGSTLFSCLIFTFSHPFQLSKIERLSQKLHIMSFIGNFNENVHHLAPVSLHKDILQSTICDCHFLLYCWKRLIISCDDATNMFVILWTRLHHIPLKWYWSCLLICFLKRYKNFILYFFIFYKV